MNEKVDSLTSKDGCKYGIDCPIRPRGTVPYCCSTCAKMRKSFVTDANRHLWSDVGGFHSVRGCRLSRKDMPKECLDYDCRQYPFVAILYYEDGNWQVLEGMGLKDNEVMAVTMAINATLRINKSG